MLIRSMAPQLIVADEIGTMDDTNAINYAISSGCKGIFTAHGQSMEDLYLNKILKELILGHFFEVIIILNSNHKGSIRDVYLLDKNDLKYKKIKKEEK